MFSGWVMPIALNGFQEYNYLGAVLVRCRFLDIGRSSCCQLTTAATAMWGQGDIDDPHAEMRRTDFIGDRDINYDGTTALDDITRCYKYWIALTDCDGFRVDTLKHVDQEIGRNEGPLQERR